MNRLTVSGLVLALAAGQVQAGEVLHGDEVISLLVGNTVEATYHNAGESGRHGFFEYYTEDGKILGWETKLEQAGNYTHYVGSWKLDGDKLCASVYGRPYSCSSFEKIKDGEYRRISDNMKFGNVTLHQGKYHPVN